MTDKTLLILTILLFCMIDNTFAQDLHIYYDAETSMIKYIYDGEEIKRPKVKKDGNIFLHVQNYNNYIYSLEVNTNNQVLQIPPGSGIGGIVSLPGGSGSFTGFGGSGAGDGYIDIDGGGDDGDGFGFAGSENSDFALFQELNLEYTSILNDMVKHEKALSQVNDEVNKIGEVREFRSFGLSEIQKIKWNPNFSPDQVKRMSYEILNKTLEIKDTAQLTLDYVIKKGDDRSQLLNSLNELEKNKAAYETDIYNLGVLSEKLEDVNLDFEEFVTMKNKVTEISEDAISVQKTIISQESAINEMVKSAGKNEMQKMTSIWYEYEAMNTNDFSYTYRTDATGDRTVLGIKFTAKDSLGNILPINKKELAPIKVPVYGGMKINVSVGISFARYFNQPQSYFLRDTVILSEDVDEFLPIITSFFHFYPQSAGNVSIGGNFGIGIPITSSENGQSLSFFLGPSFIFGKGQRIVLSTGVMGGRVQQLSQGLVVGDVLPPFSAVPTNGSYQLGYFLGVSFNIAGGN